MIKEVDELLELWARWRHGGRKSESPYAWARLIKDSEVWNAERKASIPVDALECANVETCIMALDPVLRQALEEHYLYVSQPEEKAERCRCSLRTFYRRIDRAHQRVMDLLRDQVANGLEPQAWTMLSTAA